jgi:hypothetical protein
MPQPISPEARMLAYKCGARTLEPFFQRMLDLEKRVQELEERLETRRK